MTEKKPSPDAVARALQLFELTPPLDRSILDEKRRALLAFWYPARYANLTNNPRKYMEMYRKAELMTKEVEAAYALLMAALISADG